MAKIEKVWFKNSRGQNLRGVLYPSSKNTDEVVIICHGFTGSKDEKQLVVLAETIQKAGFAAFGFDFTGNGESEGEFCDSTISQEISDVCSATDFLKERGFNKFVIIGHSLGGVISILATKKIKFECVAMLASCLDPAELLKYFNFEKVKFKNGKAKVKIWGLTKTISKEFVKDFENKNPCDVVKSLKAPILIVCGSADRDVRIETSKALYEIANLPKEIHIIKSADHLFEGKEADLAAIVSKFLKRYLK